MKRIISSVFTALALIFGVFTPREQAVAQTTSDLVGTWTLVSGSFERPDSSKGDIFGPNPLGILMFDGAGRVAYQEMRSDLPKFASNNRLEGTAGENKAVVQGCICAFGTYSVDAATNTMSIHFEGCSFPNWIGTDSRRMFTLAGDELTWSGVSTFGKPFSTVWKRAK
jgi:Lipocalin-like domain